MKKRNTPPAQGERRAITGYYPQYRIGAALLMHGLREGDLDWIALADPKAGRVDDFQIARANCIDAYQFKWSRYSGNFTFNDLIKGEESKPSLIAQLADGWKRLQARYSNKRVVVHLTTNNHPSISDQLPLHFAAFLEKLWKPIRSTSTISIPDEWRPHWETLQKASGLSEPEFNHFIFDCELEFGCILPEAEGLERYDAELFQQDIDHVTHKLFEAVYDPQQIIQLNRDELLQRLGWRERFEYRNRHTFPVDEVLYEPITKSKTALENALQELTGGYIGVFGSPGSGKSTLLTQTLRYFPARVIRYYAFIPDAQSLSVRGESINFLHDVTRAIDEAGFRAGASLNIQNRNQLLERLSEQLKMLYQDWETTGRKTIILVDGLDHIPREQNPQHSLLSDLPLPELIPQGIYFVVGSQTDQLDGLPNGVQYALREAPRRIEIGPLSREAVRQIIDKAKLLDTLELVQIEKVFQISAGHPLALVYLLRLLEGAGDLSAKNEVLNNVAPYDGNIERQYHGYWRQIDEDDELAHLLGLISRLRGVIDLIWVETFASSTLVRRLRRKFSHLFRIDQSNQWYFFHNSFRLFLINHTAQGQPGVFDEVRHRAYHQEIAKLCREANTIHIQWEELYHLTKAGDEEEVLRRARPRFFREQLLQFRPIEAIRDDIVLALRAVGKRQDVVALVRLLLSDAEMGQRGANTEELVLSPLLLSLGEMHTAIEHLRDGQRLRVPSETALSNSVIFFRHGYEEEARYLFDLSEPLEHLSGAKEVSRHDHRKEHQRLRAWARAAIYYRSIENILEAVKRVRIEPDGFASQEEIDREKMILSPNLALRLIAQRLCSRIGITAFICHADRKEKPPNYSLLLPPGPETKEIWAETRGEGEDFLPETTDPYELLKIALIELEWLAGTANIPRENIILRAAQIFHHLAKKDEWACLGEKEMRYQFNVADLKYTYNRPRANIARRAMFHLAAELVDAGMLGDIEIQEMKAIFAYHDPRMYFEQPTERPAFIPITPGWVPNRHSSNVHFQPEEAEFPLLKTPEGTIILGEYTKVKKLDWETPTAIRQSMISPFSPDMHAQELSFFEARASCSLADYHRLLWREKKQSLVIWHSGHPLSMPDTCWLALNPVIARRLGWKIATDHFLGWKDEDDQPMVWNVIWEDGLFQTRPYKSDVIVGKGWLVLAAPLALEKIVALFQSPLRQYCRVIKNWLEDNIQKETFFQKERELQ